MSEVCPLCQGIGETINAPGCESCAVKGYYYLYDRITSDSDNGPILVEKPMACTVPESHYSKQS